MNNDKVQMATVTATSPRVWVTDLPIDTIDRERAAIFVAEYLAWWVEAGRHFFGPDALEEGHEYLMAMAADAIEIAGGLQDAQRIAAVTEEDTMEREHEGAEEPPTDSTPSTPPEPMSSPQGDGDSTDEPNE